MMSEFKGSAGAWRLLPEEVDKPYIRVRGTLLGGRYKIANILTPVYENVHSREADETRANANLIAAAPDLLEALQILLVAVENIGGEHVTGLDILEAQAALAYAAIAKALGETK